MSVWEYVPSRWHDEMTLYLCGPWGEESLVPVRHGPKPTALPWSYTPASQNLGFPWVNKPRPTPYTLNRSLGPPAHVFEGWLKGSSLWGQKVDKRARELHRVKSPSGFWAGPVVEEMGLGQGHHIPQQNSTSPRILKLSLASWVLWKYIGQGEKWKW